MTGFNLLTRARVLATAALLAFVACDKDPSAPEILDLEPRLTNVDTVGTQEALTVMFARAVSAQSALDPANFVVTDLCTGLRIPGSLRLSADSLSVSFSPAQSLNFLTPLEIRVQNILDSRGQGLRAPLIDTVITRAPPVSDVSWSFLNSPTNDLVTGVFFVTPQFGYINSLGGSIFVTENGGVTFREAFKAPNINFLRQIHAFTRDTAFVVGAINVAGVTRGALFRFTDTSVVTDARLDPIFQTPTINEIPSGLGVTRLSDGYRAVFGGQSSGPFAYVYDSRLNTTTRATIAVASATSPGFTGIAISRDGRNAAISTRIRLPGAAIFTQSLAFRSTDGGLTYVQATPSQGTNGQNGIFALNGVNFRTNTEALLLGDSSVIARFDVTTGAITRLGLGNGIPQSTAVPNPVTGVITTTIFSFNRASFTDDGQTGWVVGSTSVRTPGVPDVSNGVILQTTDGGNTFTRQAIAGAPQNGLGFSRVVQVQALSPQFAALSGAEGLVAARRGDAQRTVAACSFINPRT